MEPDIAELRPAPLTRPALDPALEAGEWQLGFVAANAPVLPLRSSALFRAGIVRHELGGPFILAGRSAAYVWGARAGTGHDIYPTTEHPPAGARVLAVSVHYRDLRTVGGVLVTDPYRTALDLMIADRHEALPVIVDLRAKLAAANLARRAALSRADSRVWREAVAVLRQLSS